MVMVNLIPGGNLVMDMHSFQGVVETEISCGLMGHLVRAQTLPAYQLHIHWVQITARGILEEKKTASLSFIMK